MSRVSVVHEPSGVDYNLPSYTLDLCKALHWYNTEKEKKDARAYLRSYATKHKDNRLAASFDSVPDSKIVCTYGWTARLLDNGNSLSQKHQDDLSSFLSLLVDQTGSSIVENDVDHSPSRPSVRDYMEDRIKEYISDLEGYIDDLIMLGTDTNLYDNMLSRSVPVPYCSYINTWLSKKTEEFSSLLSSNDDMFLSGYSNIGKRKLNQLLKMLGSWSEDLGRYSQFKKANRKIRVKKAKPAGVQVAKLKYMKEDLDLKIRSISPSEIVGASQVWLYHVKQNKLAVYRTDSSTGIQVKGSVLQNYDPEMCEQKRISKPSETIFKVLSGSKIVLRKLMSDFSSKNTPVSGRVSEEWLIVRAIK